MSTATSTRGRTATVEVLGEGVRAEVPIPAAGATAAELLRAAGVTVRESGWDLFVDGARRTAEHPIGGTEDATLSYVPRTRGA
jgi:hypothetical protein